MKLNNKLFVFVFVYICIFCNYYYSDAANIDFISDLGYYHDPGNWNSGSVPSETDTALFRIESTCFADQDIKAENIGINHADAYLFPDNNVDVSNVILLQMGSLSFAKNATYGALQNTAGFLSYGDGHYRGATVNKNFVSIDKTSPHFYDTFQNQYYTSIDGTPDNLVTFGSSFFSNDTFIITNTNVLFLSVSAFQIGFTEITDSQTAFLGNVVCQKASFDITNSQCFYVYQLALSLDTVFKSENSTHTFTQGEFQVLNSSVIFRNDSVYLTDSLFGAIGNSNVTLVNSNLKFENSSIVVGENGSLRILDNSTLTINNGTGVLDGEGFLHTSNSYFQVKVLNNFGFILLGNSKILIRDESTFIIDGRISALNDSSIQVFKSKFEIIGMVLVGQRATFLLSESWKLNVVKEMLAIAQDAIVQVDQSQLQVEGLLTVQDRAKLNIYDSELSVPGNITCKDESVIFTKNSKTSVAGSIYSNGVIYSKDSDYNIQGSLNIAGLSKFVNSTVNVDGNLLVAGSFLQATDCTFVIKNNMTVILGIVVAENTSITIENGVFNVLYGILQLNSSEFRNLHGVVNTRGNIEIFAGTTFINDGTIVLSSNILPSNQSSPDSDFKLENTGQFIIDTAESNIQVPFVNSGSVDLKSNTVFIKEYNQNNGLLSLKGGVINSEQEIVISGGSISGYGTFNKTLNNNGGMGSRDASIHQFNINGDFNHQSNASFIITILTLNDFTNINITNTANFNGTIEVRISNDILNSLQSTENGTQVNLINYNGLGSKEGLNQIKFSTFDPATPTKDEPKNDECVAKSTYNDRSFAVLLNTKCSGSGEVNEGGITNKLSGGAIAGIVIGCVAAAVIGIALVHYRERLHLSYRLTKKNLNMKLKTLKKGTDKPQN